MTFFYYVLTYPSIHLNRTLYYFCLLYSYFFCMPLFFFDCKHTFSILSFFPFPFSFSVPRSFYFYHSFSLTSFFFHTFYFYPSFFILSPWNFFSRSLIHWCFKGSCSICQRPAHKHKEKKLELLHSRLCSLVRSHNIDIDIEPIKAFWTQTSFSSWQIGGFFKTSLDFCI